jgi:hypothetical protein
MEPDSSTGAVGPPLAELPSHGYFGLEVRIEAFPEPARTSVPPPASLREPGGGNRASAAAQARFHGCSIRSSPEGTAARSRPAAPALSHLSDESVACCATNKIRNCSYPDCRSTIQAATFLGSCWQASARGSPDYSSSRRCNRLVTSQAAGASSGTASRISQTVTHEAKETR